MTFAPEHAPTCPAALGGLECTCGAWNQYVPGPIQMVEEGPTLRDQFAMAALTGLISSTSNDNVLLALSKNPNTTENILTKRAFEFADAMLKAREE